MQSADAGNNVVAYGEGAPTDDHLGEAERAFSAAQLPGHVIEEINVAVAAGDHHNVRAAREVVVPVSNLGRSGEMRATLRTLAAVLAATLVVAPAAPAAELTRDGFRERAEPICKRDTLRSRRILRGAQQRIKSQKLAPAGRQFVRVSRAFGQAVGQLVRVPRPPADGARLKKWFKFLRIVQMRLRVFGKRLIEGDRIKATHASIHLERSANAANNVGFIFEFDYCRLTRSRFR